MKQKWYVATLVIRCRVENEPAPYTCDEQIRVIRASNPNEAYEKALTIGRGEEVTYKNESGEDVFWEFGGLEDLDDLDSAIRDGTEIRSRLFGHQNPESLVSEREQLKIFQSPSDVKAKTYRILTENIPADDT